MGLSCRQLIEMDYDIQHIDLYSVHSVLEGGPMPGAQQTIIINATPDKVFQVITDYEEISDIFERSLVMCGGL